MDTLILIMIAVIFGYMVGRSVSNLINAMTFREILKDLGIKDADIEKLREKLDSDEPIKDSITGEIELTPLEIKLEQHQGVIYAYRVKDDQFLGQGKNRDELIESLKKNLTNVRVIVAEENGAKLIQNA
jgi:hypothetical protein